MSKTKRLLKVYGARLAMLAFVLAAVGLVIYGAVKRFRTGPTVYVLPTVSAKPDSIKTAPAPAERSAKSRWDSLKNIQP